MNTTNSAMVALLALTAPMALGGCAVLAGAAAGAAAVDYFVDDNDVCDGPNDAGILDSDCKDKNPR